ncbi:MAG: acyl-CoA desaturase [Pseudomonadota bacterium]
MTGSAAAYANPRTDFDGQRGDAAAGFVRFDPMKLVWVGAMLLGGTIGSALTVTPGAVVVFIVFTATTLCLGHSLGMHRRFIHRSYECPRWLEYLFVHLGVLVGLAGPLGMLRTHDTRDWAQRQRHCHDYFSHGQPWYRDLVWQLVGTIELASPPEIRIETDIAADRVYQVMERTWMWQQLPWAALLFALGGWAWVFWGICSRVSVSIIGHWLVGYFAHNRGEQRWRVSGAAVQGYNLPWFALLTMGESWHNNHHAYPGSARLGLEPGQHDPGWWVLAGLARLGLVWNVITAEQLQIRSDLCVVGSELSQQPSAAG